MIAQFRGTPQGLLGKKSRSRGLLVNLLFNRLLEQAVITEPVTYDNVVQSSKKHSEQNAVEHFDSSFWR